MIAVDSSVWIDFFGGKITRHTIKLRELIESDTPLIVGDLVLCEVLQGHSSAAQALKSEAALRDFDIVSMLTPELAIVAANNFRVLRAGCITVRNTIDVIIATYCIVNKVALLHADRDFNVMEMYLGLTTVHAGWAAHDRARTTGNALVIN